jgi:acyl-CoA synthetase (NDP forming)
VATDSVGHPLDSLFRPRSVAIVGASTNPAKRGNHAVRSLLESGYQGRILPVNPAGGELFALPVARSVSELEGDIDLALICTPAQTVAAMLDDCAAAGAAAAVVLAVGFRESGAAGAALEAEVREVARRTGIRVVGPNTSGILNPGIGLNLIGMRDPPAGALALLVQSGNLTLSLVTEARARSEQGFSIAVGVGNETDIAFHEYLEYLGSDAATRAVLMHAEGMRDGRAFMDVARRVAPEKPIVFLKGGRSDAAGAVALSHTGALVGSYDVFRAALRQAGVIEVHRSDELFHVGETLASQPALRIGTGVAIVSDGGGQATLSVDSMRASGAPLATLSPATRSALRDLLGPAAAVANPVDLAGAADADPSIFGQAVRMVAADPAVGAVLVVGLFGGYAIRFDASLADLELTAARTMVDGTREGSAALVVHSIYAASRSVPLRTLGAAGVPVVESLDVACRCVAALRERGALLDDRRAGRNAAIGTDAPPAVSGQQWLLETAARELVAEHGVTVAPATFCRTAAEAVAAGAAYGGPVAVRVVSEFVSHKTEAGGIALGVEGGAAIEAAVAHVTSSATAWLRSRERVELAGVLVGPVLPQPIVELLVGVRRDPQFGPVLTVGLGGTLAEVLDDVAVRVLPVGSPDVVAMLQELRGRRMLEGYRGAPGVDYDSVIRIIMGVSACFLAHAEVSELELNPVFVYRDRAVAVDVRGARGSKE